MNRLRLLLACFIVLMLITIVPESLHSQVPDPGMAASAPVPGSGHNYIGIGAETVNPADGSVSFNLPLDPPTGRNISASFGIRYSGNEQYYPSNGCGNNAPCNTQGTFGWHSFWEFGHPPYQIEGWGYTLPILTAQTSIFANGYVYQQSACPNSNRQITVTNGYECQNTCYSASNYVFQGLNGPQYSLPIGKSFADPQNTESGFCPVSPNNVKSPGNNHGILSTIGTNTTTVIDQAGTSYSFLVGNADPGEPQAPNYAPSNWGLLANSITDRNGNTITLNSTSNGYIDPTGRTAVSWSGIGDAQDQITISGIGPITVKWGNTTMTFPESATVVSGSNTCTLTNLYPNGTQLSGYSVPTYNEPVITEIDLPNGQKYTFQYDGTYGKLSQINFPDGGYVQYTWGLSQNARSASASWTVVTTDSTTPVNCEITYAVPVITDRYVNDGHQTVLHQTFSYTTAWNGNNWTSKTTTVATTDEISGQTTSTVYTYGSVSPDSSPFGGPSLLPQVPVEQRGLYKDGSGTVYKEIDKSWLNAQSITADQTVLYSSGTPDVATTTGRCYDANEQVVDTYEYGFTTDPANSSQPADACSSTNGVSSTLVGPLRRLTTTAYHQFFFPSDNTVNPVSVNGTHIVDAPDSVSIQDGNAVQLRRTAYVYDAGGLFGSGAWAPGLLSPPGASRGNVTSIQKLISGSTYATTTLQYWDTGQVYSITDPCGNPSCSDVSGGSHTTNYDYHDNYASGTGTAPGQTFAYLTHITDHLLHNDYFSWGFNDGQLRSHQDPNGQVTNYFYNDSGNLARLTQIGYPDGGATYVGYNDSGPNPSMTVCKLMNTSTGGTACPVSGAASGSYIVSTNVRDGIGHTVQTQLASDPVGTVYTNTIYDGLGQTYEQANPTRCSSSAGYLPTSCSEPTWGYTEISYDAIGRKKQLTHEPDGTAETWTFSGPTTTFTDERGNEWSSITDGLGHLTTVNEPNGTGQAATMATNYTYDAADDLLSVNQTGGGSTGARNRSFAYDNMGRLLASQNPEDSGSINAPGPASISCPGVSGSWTTCYVYDLNGNVSSKTDNRSVTTAYTYDAENRVLQKVYSDGNTPTEKFGYDGKDENGTAIANEQYAIHRLTKAINSTSSGTNAASEYFHDQMGRVTTKSAAIPGDFNWDINVTAQYDKAGDTLSLTNGSPLQPITFTDTYNGAGQLSTLTSSWYPDANHPQTIFQANSTSTTAPAYGPSGGLMNAALGFPSGSPNPDATLVRAYDARLRASSGTFHANAVELSSPTGSIPISGSEQSKTVGTSSGTGWFTINGGENTTTIQVGCGPYGQTCSETIYDSGTVTVTINGTQYQTSYGSSSTQSSIASALATAINNGPDTNASWTSGSSTVNLTARATGAATNYSLSWSSATTNTTYFSSASFTVQLSGSTLTNGSNGTAVYDTGTITATVNGVSASANWVQGDTASSVASKLASAMNSAMGGFLTASCSNCTTVTVTSNSELYWPISVSATDTNTSNFSSASFSASASGMTVGSTSEDVYKYTLSYDAVSNVESLTDSIAGNWNFNIASSVGGYGYDTLNRLVAGQATSGPYNGQYSCWTYDAFGNRTMEAISGTACNSSPASTTWASFNSSNQITGTNLMTGGDYYDAAGDVTNDGRNQYLYDGAGRICAVRNITSGSVTEYVYDAEGNRVAQGSLSSWPSLCPAATSGNGFTLTKQYIVGIGGEQLGEQSVSGGTASWTHTNIYANGALLATYAKTSAGSNTFFDFGDWLGTKRVELGADGCLTGWPSLPFGDNTTGGTATAVLQPISIGNTPQCADATEHHFTGKERDSESGNDYFGARYYASTMGRWLSPDPIIVTRDMANPQSLNKYVYVFNSPLTRVDPTGKWPTGFHHAIIEDTFGNLGAHEVKVLENASDWVDSISAGNQAPERSYMHAMRDGEHNQSVEDAQRESQKYIDSELSKAVKAQLDFEAHGGKGNSDDALTSFGHALHTVTDSTSPEHAGYQPWYCLVCSSAWTHHEKEEKSAESADEDSAEARYLAHVAAAELWARYQKKLDAERTNQSK